ncbi:hypothetical protein FBEOM_1744 [Fusarium beomiforme]|uniref:Uncharacterized protein n=1 Tax=Fusarium beomiforme TaxID=44412 RepID=A0A9P5E2P9_9HYPO|nr:hypothetical protein FBEOM_1744 [Fusarium beomiforme]
MGPGLPADHSKTRPLAIDPSTVYTLIQVPNNSTAYVRWPTLANFKSTFQPRACKTIPYGGDREDKPSLAEVLMCLPYMYHDLGVMVFDGPDKNQIQIMGYILQQMARHEGRLQHRDWESPGELKLRYNKWNVYRIRIDPKKHLDSNTLNTTGRLKPSGLYDLTNIAFERWKRNAETINGLRLPQLYAYVATALHAETIYMSIELHTVGTMRFVGATNLQLRHKNRASDSTSAEDKMMSIMRRDTSDSSSRSDDRPTLEHTESQEAKDLLELYNTCVPNKVRRKNTIAPEVTKKLWSLEQTIWYKRKQAKQKEKAELRKAKKARKKAEKTAEYQEKVDDRKETGKRSEEFLKVSVVSNMCNFVKLD